MARLPPLFTIAALFASQPCWGSLITDASVGFQSQSGAMLNAYEWRDTFSHASIGSPAEGFQGVAWAAADYGALHVFNEITLYGAPAGSAVTTAAFSEVLTPSGFTGPGFITYQFSFWDNQTDLPDTSWTTHVDVKLTNLVTPDLIQLI